MRGAPQHRFDETPVTWVIVLAYVTILVRMAGYDDESGFMDPSAAAALDHGAQAGILLVDEPWRLLTHAFVHHGALHLGFNLWFLSWSGPQLERELGSLRFGALYLVAALGGGIAGSFWHAPGNVLAGGSGALFGMMGAAIGLLMRRGRSQLEFLDHRGPRNLLTLIAANLALGFLIPMISNAAHIGGLVSGFACAYWFLEKPRIAPDRIFRLTQAGLVALLLALGLYSCRPVLDEWWHLRRAASHSLPDALRREHAEVIGLDPMQAVFTGLRRTDGIEEAWGASGRRLRERWRD
jgi:membrane associated rhomboid family serine protease